ncbi:unnamed protein product [Rotaria socialis]|nr:unnamed protein product [Rotaria socialis]
MIQQRSSVSSSNLTQQHLLSSTSNLIQPYSTSTIENLLKQKDNSKQFLVIKNDQKKNVSSLAWPTFGFPAKRLEDDCYQRISRTMISEAVFREFSVKICKKLAVSDQNPPGIVRNSMQESGNRIQLPVLTGFCRFRLEPDPFTRILLP